MGGEMGIRQPPSPAPAPQEAPPGWAFAASARRLDPAQRSGEQALGPEPDSHREAWAAYDEVGEVGTLVTSSASLLSQCRLYVGWIDEQQDERRLRDEDGAALTADGFTEQLVADAEFCLARFSDAGGSQRGLLLAMAENFDVTGDSCLVGWPIDADGKPHDQPTGEAGERWEVVSRGAISKAQGRWALQIGGEQAVKLPARTVVYRMWRKHPRRPDDSRGWVKGSLDIIRDLRIFTLAQRSAGRSSIPAKILITAQEASPKDLTPGGFPAGGQVPPSAASGLLMGGMPGVFGPAGPGSPPAAPATWAQQLERLIGDAVMEVLRDAQSGRAVIPAVLAVADKYVKSFDSIDLSRPVDSALSGLVEQARTRLAEAADCPPEMLKGLGETNRWNGAQIADDEYRRYFKPKAMTIADAWTTELLRPALLDLGYAPAVVNRLRVLVDARGVVAEPDKSKLATEGLKLGAISWAAWRTACGFSELDAPTPEERAEILAAVAGMNAPPALPAGDVNQKAGSAAPIEATAIEAELILPRRPALEKIARTRSTASIAHGSMTGQELADQLTTIEQTARTRLEEAAEASLDQAISRGGAKLKTWARKDQGLRALLATTEARDVPAVLGPERARDLAAAQFADDADRRREDLFAAALLALLASYGRIAAGAFQRAARLLGVAIIGPGEPLPSWATTQISPAEIQRNVDAGGQVLRASMLQLADREIFNPTTAAPLGELSTFRVPAPVIRRTLASAGGASIEPGLAATEDAAPGLVFGPTLAGFQPDRLGWEWIYGDEPRMRPWEPHMAIDGQVFSGPEDPGLAGLAPDGGPGFPGDHDGCRCDWQAKLADPEDPGA